MFWTICRTHEKKTFRSPCYRGPWFRRAFFRTDKDSRRRKTNWEGRRKKSKEEMLTEELRTGESVKRRSQMQQVEEAVDDEGPQAKISKKGVSFNYLSSSQEGVNSIFTL